MGKELASFQVGKRLAERPLGRLYSLHCEKLPGPKGGKGQAFFRLHIALSGLKGATRTQGRDGITHHL